MNKSVSPSKDICGACGEGALSVHVKQEEHELNGYKALVPLMYKECDVCLSQLAGAKEINFNNRSYSAFKKKAEGLLSGEQIKEFRESFHITQTELATLFGGGKVAFSRYENNDIVQSSPMDSLIYLCIENPHNLILLSEKKKLSLSSRTLKAIEGYCYNDLGSFLSTFQKKFVSSSQKLSDLEFKAIFDYDPFQLAANDGDISQDWAERIYKEASYEMASI